MNSSIDKIHSNSPLIDYKNTSDVQTLVKGGIYGKFNEDEK